MDLGFLGKPKAKSRELMLKIDNIIPLQRPVIPNDRMKK